MEKVFNIYRNILFAIAIAAISILLLPMIFGIRPFVVLSGSMEPIIHTGSLCYINQNVESTDIVTGDVIAFNIDDATVVHRVIGLDEENRFITKGDANEVQDLAPVSSSNYVGKQVFSIPYLGYVSQWLQTTTGIVVVVAAIALSFISSAIYRKVDNEEIQENSKNQRKVEDNSNEQEKS